MATLYIASHDIPIKGRQLVTLDPSGKELQLPNDGLTVQVASGATRCLLFGPSRGQSGHQPAKPNTTSRNVADPLYRSPVLWRMTTGLARSIDREIIRCTWLMPSD